MAGSAGHASVETCQRVGIAAKRKLRRAQDAPVPGGTDIGIRKPRFPKMFDGVPGATDMGEKVGKVDADPGVGRVELDTALEQPHGHVKIAPLEVDIAERGVAS